MSGNKNIESERKFIGAIPQKDGGTLSIPLGKGETLYVLGRNGSGKSSLLYHWARNSGSTVFIAGNREVVFASSAVSLSAQDALLRSNWAKNVISNELSRVEKAYHNNADRLNALLFKLKSASDDTNRVYRQAHRDGRVGELARIEANEPTVLLNDALRRTSISLKVDWNKDSTLIVRKDGYEGEFGVRDMSDGERAALILAAEVILGDNNAVVIVDEPERHLHRSISSPLMQYLREIRPDLSWVIATHDLSLPRDDVGASVVILYQYFGQHVWQAELIADPGALPAPLSDAVYGAREKVLFVEGTEASRDRPLYQQIFKGITIVPVGTCRDVCDAIAGLNVVPQLHRMESRGLVDGDNRDDSASLREKGVSVLDVYAVESVYYHPKIIASMLRESAEEISENEVEKAAVEAIKDTLHLAKMTAYRSYRERHLRSLLDETTFSSVATEAVMVNGPGLVSAAHAELEKLKAEGNWLEIARRYKIKATGAPQVIARKLGFSGYEQYERAVIKALANSDELRTVMESIVPSPFA
ncbi:AAA family ATPase [Burkholderia sp. AU30198]|uniref:AAA family ATPase n=1 Tax=Burkholderia sp. AU30198 TaxID=2879627 RepID=UPI001CF29429|nr:AAA family ATPase [Burkholderia sp. AU30198]MCA8295019.1 AAA family ATPase [Burkholderia sp. AU30198]